MILLARIMNVAKDSLPNNLNRLFNLLYRFKAAVYYRWTFGSFGKGSYLRTPCYLANTHFMHIGNKSFVAKGARLEAVVTGPHRRPELRIGDNVNIEQYAHITCHNRIIIGSNVSIAPMCSITDSTHPIDGVGDGSLGSKLLDDDSEVSIGEGTMIGVGSVILPNVHIGMRCVIGANSVVTGDIPDRSVAVGAPARVIRSLDA